jgi:ABC-type sugar transport system ATPase subunit
MLVATSLAKSFGPIEALRGVSLSVSKGEIRAVCGENGAGKSTFMKVLMGIVGADSGTIEIDGTPQTIDSPQKAQDLGLAMVAQELSLAPHLSILDNIWLGSRAVPFLHRNAKFRRRAAEALRVLDVEYDLDCPVNLLPLGKRQIVEIARLLVRDARLLILDEPTASLSDIEIEHMLAALKALKAKGRSILYVTHRLGEVYEICDSVTVLRNGKNVADRPVADVSRSELIELMLGRRFSEMYPRSTEKISPREGLAIRGLNIPGSVSNFSMEAPRGQITCIAGQVGAGASTIIRAIAGLVPSARGDVTLDGRALALGSTTERVRRNITFVSEDRASEGIFRRNVLENMVAHRMSENTHFGVLLWSNLRRLATEFCGKVTIDPNRLSTSAFNLSGGNQQKILFSRALGRKDPGVILINEPTRGVDVGARAEIYKLLREFCAQGYALLMTSSDLEEVVGISDTVVTIYRGKYVSRYDGNQIVMSAILSDITHPIAADVE